jgi:putative membrane protein insertion efficiency factor
MRKAILKILKIYQYISALTPASCRYYPTCSEYAKWQFKFNRLDRAIFNSIVRILRCNQLFKGGIDYPLVVFNPPSLLNIINRENIEIKYWLIHKKNNKYFVIKVF